MRKRQHIGVGSIVIAVALIGCASEQPTTTRTHAVMAEMIGMKKEEMPVCLGRPTEQSTAKQSTEGVVETWVYSYGTCTVTLTIDDNGAVTKATSSFKAPEDYKAKEEPQTEDQQCAHVPEVVGCIRWLRR